MSDKKITNTSKSECHPDWLLGGNPDAIEAQEKRGQDELVNSKLLPTDVQDRAEIEKLGVIFGEPIEGDPLFCKAQIPNGWKVIATDSPMRSELLDENGVAKASIFYKAAFYDRYAFMCLK